MGLFGDIAGKVVLKYEADTAQAKIALRELTGEQKANAKAAIQGMEDQKAAHDRMVKGITVGLGIAGGAIALGIGAFKSYAEQSRLAAASSGADMDRLRSASHGLVTNIGLMSVAAEGMNGRWKLTSAEMEKVLGAAVELERKGFGPLDEITKKLGEAIKKGEIDPLKELGVAYDETLAKTDKRAAALKALAVLSKAAADGVESETERIRQSATRLENMWDDAKAATGEWVVSTLDDLAIVANAMAHPFTPQGGGLAAQPAGASVFDETMYLDPTTGSWVNFRGLVEGTVRNAKRTAELERAALDAAAAEAERIAKLQQGYDEEQYRRAHALEQRRAEQEAALELMRSKRLARRGGGGGRTPKPNPYANDVIMHGPLFDQTMGAGAAPDENPYLAQGFAPGGNPDPFANGRAGDGPSFMEKMLGPVDQFDAYATAWQGFEGAVTAGYEALVTGSESFGKAAKRVIGQTIMAEGSHMLVLALREGAQAIAALAGGNFAAAGTHGLAAAKFGAGAALAGVVAHSLGAGGSATAAGASAGGGAAGSSTTAADNTPRNTNIVLGHGWDDETNRQRAARFARAQRQAASYEGAPAGVVYA